MSRKKVFGHFLSETLQMGFLPIELPHTTSILSTFSSPQARDLQYLSLWHYFSAREAFGKVAFQSGAKIKAGCYLIWSFHYFTWKINYWTHTDSIMSPATMCAFMPNLGLNGHGQAVWLVEMFKKLILGSKAWWLASYINAWCTFFLSISLSHTYTHFWTT